MCHRNELNETNLMKLKKKLKQVQLKQHDESSNVDILLGILKKKMNQKIEELVKRETFKYASFGW